MLFIGHHQNNFPSPPPPRPRRARIPDERAPKWGRSAGHPRDTSRKSRQICLAAGAKHQAAAPGCLLALSGPSRCAAWSLLGRSGLGGRGGGRGGGWGTTPYVHPQHMPGVKSRPPGPSRVGARRHGEVLAEERAGSWPCCPKRGCFGEGWPRKAAAGAALLLPGRTGGARGGFVEAAGVGLGFACSPVGAASAGGQGLLCCPRRGWPGEL